MSAFQFAQSVIVDGLPRGFSNKFFRLNPENKTVPSEFEIELLCGSKIFVYGFSVILSTGSVLEEYLYEKISPSSKKMLFSRDTALGLFDVGNYFKSNDAIANFVRIKKYMLHYLMEL